MHELLALFRELTNPEWITAHGGLYLVAFIIFAETGLFVGFFLPGDSLLFITGMIIANSHNPFDSSPLLFERKDSLLFKRKYIIQAKEFYDKKGGTAIILARFLPIVRTFAPIVAGVVQMDKKRFFLNNVIGCVAWIISMTMAGYLLGENEWVKNNLEKIVIALILVTTGPVLFKMFFSKKKEHATE